MEACAFYFARELKSWSEQVYREHVNRVNTMILLRILVVKHVNKGEHQHRSTKMSL